VISDYKSSQFRTSIIVVPRASPSTIFWRIIWRYWSCTKDILPWFHPSVNDK
jgi:hypothetical protein